MKRLILSIIFLVFLTSLYHVKASDCEGSISLVLSPNLVEGESEVKAIATGLMGTACYGKTIQITRDSCSGPKICSCESKGTGCSCSFKATLPSIGGGYFHSEYNYYACVDKNGNGDYLDFGEQGFAMLIVRRKIPFIPLGLIETISQIIKSFVQAFAQLFKL
jgi:hypothetical protein